MAQTERSPVAAPSTGDAGTEGDGFRARQTRRRPLSVAVVGSTGSIGTSTLEVIAGSAGRFGCHLLAAHRSVDRLLEQARRFRPAWMVVVDETAAAGLSSADLPPGTRLAVGARCLDELLAAPEVDRVVSAIVGAAGLRSTWAALDAGKTVALANKETLVAAGQLMTRLAARRNAALLPVDSEHAAIHQALRAGAPHEVRRLILTASGGPFRGQSAATMAAVTPAAALKHPTWSMGPKITVDSATMMNKALELIEARWLFDIPAEKLEVVVHPQSVVHSLVEFVDGSVIAQLGPPDMKMPIQYALAYPERFPGPAKRLDLTAPLALHFEPADPERFPAVGLGLEAAARGGTAGAALNAGNEVAVGAFLAGRLPFTEIAGLAGRALREHPYQADPTLDDIHRLDAWARQEVAQWMSS